MNTIGWILIVIAIVTIASIIIAVVLSKRSKLNAQEGLSIQTVKRKYVEVVNKHNKVLETNAKLKAQAEDAKLKLKLERNKTLKVKVKLDDAQKQIQKYKILLNK